MAQDFKMRQLEGEEYKEASELSYEDYSVFNALELIKYRSQNAPHLFQGCFVNNKLIAYVSASQSEKPHHTEDRIDHHIPDGETVLLHRIWVHKDHRKQGIARRLFADFKEKVMALNPQPKRICLISREAKILLFRKLGFILLGPRDVTYYKNGECYFEMEFAIEQITMSNNFNETQVVTTRLLTDEECISAWVLEVNGYSDPDESASLQTIRYRLLHAPHLFMGRFVDDKLIAMICGVQSDKPTLTTDSLYKHVPNGETVCVHTVCVQKDFRRKGIALGLIEDYIKHVKQLTPRPKRICLVAHDYYIPLYTKAGFKLTGPSDFQWCGITWYGLEYALD